MAAQEQERAYLHDLGPTFEVERPLGRSPLVILCEHASARIPESLNHLGLPPEDRLKHIAWDRGAMALARHLSAHFDAPLVASTVSRLVYDCNRRPDAPDAIPTRSEHIDILGNQGLSPEHQDDRRRLIHQPFHAAASALMAARAQPVLVTVHSFTPVFMGEVREVELGLLADGDDDRLAQAMWVIAPEVTTLYTEVNEPYDPKQGMTYSAAAHALTRGALHVMFEVRNDLISTDAQVAMVAPALATLLERGLQACGFALD